MIPAVFGCPLVASLWEELAAFHQCVDTQEHLASHNVGDEAEDED